MKFLPLLKKKFKVEIESKKRKKRKMALVKLTLSHPRTGAIVPEKRYMLSQSISAIKANIATHFPTPADNMRLVLLDAHGDLVDADMSSEKLLGYYQPQDGFTIEVMDVQESTAVVDYSDVSKVEKVTISEEAYSQRNDTARAFRERCIAQQRAMLAAQGIAAAVELHNDSYKDCADLIHVGDRCQVSPGERLGTVRYVGRVPTLKLGFWIGVEYDEPVGKNDGTCGGVRLFECRPLYGGFVRPEFVTVGDFPPEEF